MKAKKIFYLYLILGVMLMINTYGCFPAGKFSNYTSQDPAINLTLDYPQNWQARENRGSADRFSQVMFVPNADSKGFKPSITFTVWDSSKINGESSNLTLTALADDLVKRRMQFKETKVLTRSEGKILDGRAIFLELSYKTLKNLLRPQEALVPVKEKLIVFMRGKNFYVLRYQNISQDYPKFQKAFEHVAASLKPKG